MAAGETTTAIRSDILNQFSRNTSDATEQALCLTWMQYAYRDINIKVGKHIAVKKTTTLTCTASDAYVDLPSDFMAVIFVRDTTNNANLNYQDVEEFLRDHNEDEAASQAQDYTLWWDATDLVFQLRLGPMPDSTDSLALDYWAWPADINTSLDPLVGAWRKAIFAGGLYYAARFYERENPALWTEFKNNFNESIGDVYRLENRRIPKRRVIPLITRKSDMEPYVKRRLPEV